MNEPPAKRARSGGQQTLGFTTKRREHSFAQAAADAHFVEWCKKQVLSISFPH